MIPTKRAPVIRRSHRAPAILLIAGLTSVVTALAGCGSSSPSSSASSSSSSSTSAKAKSVHIAFIYDTTVENFAQEMALGAAAAAKQTGITITNVAPPQPVGAQQVSEFDSASQTSKNGIALATLFPDLFVRPLNQAQSLGIPLIDFHQTSTIDVSVDGADEIAPGLALTKGGGGALLREKIVASAAKKFIVVADSSKIVKHLGKFPLPVEVITMAAPLVAAKLSIMGVIPRVRQKPAGGDYVTDEGNLILDCSCGEILDPQSLADKIRAIVGVVEHGLFLNMADLAIVSSDTGDEIKILTK